MRDDHDHDDPGAFYDEYDEFHRTAHLRARAFLQHLRSKHGTEHEPGTDHNCFGCHEYEHARFRADRGLRND